MPPVSKTEEVSEDAAPITGPLCLKVKMDEKSQEWLDQNQYSRNGILRYEQIFGRTWVSVGGETTTDEFLKKLDLKPGMQVLDIGCGTGGSAFYMARKYGVHVHGVDLSTNQIGIANDYRNEMESEVKHRVQFHLEDATMMGYPKDFYDLVYSRDAIMHINDKDSLYTKIHHCLKPGGKLLVSDYSLGEAVHSKTYTEFVAKRDYQLTTVKKYGKILEKVGFTDVVAEDKADYMLEIMEMELGKFAKIKAQFEKDFSAEDYSYIVSGWKDKLVWCKKGEFAWGLYVATK